VKIIYTGIVDMQLLHIWTTSSLASTSHRRNVFCSDNKCIWYAV